ncbi:MAG: GMC oxidoreductase, partial [Gammaproteobacteria bacterium]
MPAGLRGAFTEIFGTVNLLHKLAVPDKEKHERGHPADDIYEVDGQRIDRSALYAVMGDDGAIGSIGLFRNGESVSSSQLTDDDDGVGRIDWPGASNIPLFDHQVGQVTTLADSSGGTILPNPVWKLLPPDMTWLLDDLRGPVTTVHPLGGCAMGNTMAGGVVDDIGRVFDAATPGTVHSGLVVLDGSIVPTALGTNPALTIAAVSLRAAELLAAEWGYAYTAPNLTGDADQRPVYRGTDVAFDPAPTQVEIIERLAGPVKFKDADGRRTTRIVELTLRFDEHEIAALTRPNEYGAGATLNVSTDASEAPKSSRIRIYEKQDWDDLNLKYVPPYRLEKKLDEIAVFAAPVTGTMNVFLREKSRRLGRTARAFGAYLANRGGRDIWQSFGESDGGPNGCSRFKSGLALASRSGEIRLLEYVLDIGTPTKTDISLSGTAIVGRKEFTYRRKSNPWRQLMDVSLDEFPGLRRRERRRVLRLDPVHLTRIGVPLFHVTRQADGATAIADLIAFFGYFIRLLVGLHIWSFRQPDAETGTKTIDRFPSRAGNMPIPQIFPVDLGSEPPAGDGDDGAPVPGEMRLTRFPGTDSSKHPVLLIPGYSTSGTAFSHRALYPNFASHLWDSGRDVWILDMRSSSAFEATAKKPWSFEQIAHRDLTVALHYVYDKTGKSVDIHAHCMGAAMLSMALLRPTPVPGFPHVDTTKMPEWIHRVSLSQVGPLVVMSPANIFRSYAFRYFLQYLPDADYQFRPEEPTLADDLLDRILSTLPYPEAEFTITNPLLPWKRTEWTRTRHRMDALYGRSFNLVNVGDEVLDHIDDQFGPLSLRTVTQAIHFARYSIITDVHGRNTFVSRDSLEDFWKGDSFGESIRELETLSLHGPENGLADIRTLDRIDAVMVDAGMTYAFRPVGVEDGAGHQDALIGHEKLRKETFEAVREFFDKGLAKNTDGPSTMQVAFPPWIGPIVTDEKIEDEEAAERAENSRPRTTIRIGTRPTHRKPECAVMLPVEVHDGRVTRVGGAAFSANDPDSQNYIINNLIIYHSSKLQDEYWDVFLRPEFPGLDGYGLENPYDGAVLVLVIYSETTQLGLQPHPWFRMDFSRAEAPELIPIDPMRGDPVSGLPPPDLPDADFPRHLLTIVSVELARQALATDGSADASSAPAGGTVLLSGPG